MHDGSAGPWQRAPLEGGTLALRAPAAIEQRLVGLKDVTWVASALISPDRRAAGGVRR